MRSMNSADLELGYVVMRMVTFYESIALRGYNCIIALDKIPVGSVRYREVRLNKHSVVLSRIESTSCTTRHWLVNTPEACSVQSLNG